MIKLKDAVYLAIEEGNDMKLTYEEKVFFDVLSSNLEVLELMESEILMLIEKDLTKSVHGTMDITGDEWYKSDKVIEQVLEQVQLQCINLK